MGENIKTFTIVEEIKINFCAEALAVADLLHYLN